MLFYDPEKPIATCESNNCNDCNTSVHCHFTLKDCIHFLLISVPPFLLGGTGIYNLSGWMLLPWILYVVIFFGFIEIRVLCSHCPHYAESGKSLKCWANYGSPKLWKYRPAPMTKAEKTVLLGSFLLIWGYPLVILAVSFQIFLLIVYAMTTCGFFLTLKIYMCSRCMNVACPLNYVDNRDEFFKRNPSVNRGHWHDD